VKTLIFGVIIGLVLVPVGVYYYFAMGWAPVATSAAPMPFELMLADKALHAHREKEKPQKMPPWDESNLLRGAQIYKDTCAVCHGLPGQPESAIAKGMYPHPPQLFVGKGINNLSPAEAYWAVSGGIRLTGMPAFSQTLSDAQLWQVSIFAVNTNVLPDAAKEVLAAPPAAPAEKTTLKQK
jgi:thiosulfate dehydrogenase